MKHLAFGLGCAVMLSACGGGGGTGVRPTGPLTLSSFDIPFGYEADIIYASNDGSTPDDKTTLLILDGFAVELTEDTLRSRPGKNPVVALSDAGGPIGDSPFFVHYILLSDTGDTSAYVTFRTGRESPGFDPVFGVPEIPIYPEMRNVSFGGEIESTVDTIVPRDIVYQIEGPYIGALGIDVTESLRVDTDATALVYGDARLVADFVNSTISGAVTNRVARDIQITDGSRDIALSDITLRPAEIDPDLFFVGDATSTDTGGTPINGVYVGVISGLAADEAAGLVSLPNETGIYIGSD